MLMPSTTARVLLVGGCTASVLKKQFGHGRLVWPSPLQRINISSMFDSINMVFLNLSPCI